MPQKPKIALVFDFDDTLAPDCTSGLLQQRGVAVDEFWESVKQLLGEGWDPVPAYLAKILQDSRSNQTAGPLTQQKLQEWGEQIKFYNGVPTLFKRIREFVAEISPDLEVEFYLISSGIGEILRASRIAKNFKNIWACDFSYAQDGSIEHLKNIVSFTDKTRYLFQITKGLVGEHGHSRPFEVNKAVSPAETYIPFTQMIFVGDGYTDIPCFSLVRKNGGIAFGVYDTEKRETWSRAWAYIEDRRISNLAPSDYGDKSALMINLYMAIQSITAQIKLGQASYQG